MKKALLLILPLFFVSVFTRANNYNVTTVSDTGSGSLRAMVDSSNSHPGLDTITLHLSLRDTIHLSSELPAITDTLVITGLPCQNPTISGDTIGFGTSVFFTPFTSSIPLTLSYLNIFNCKSTGPGVPGVVNSFGPLYINYRYFYGNSYVELSALSGGGTGGAVFAPHIWAYNSTFKNNSCTVLSGIQTGLGGALASGDLNLFNCTFIGNYAYTEGGAVQGIVHQIQNCTFTGNYAGLKGGAISSISNPGTLTSTIGNSIFWGNTIGDTTHTHFAGIEFGPADTSGGCNILQDTAALDSFKKVSTDIAGVDPMFAAFGYYRGCVPVLPIRCGSPAENHADCAGATTTDAEGIMAQGIRDAGAFEITPPNLAADSIDSIPQGSRADLYNYFNVTGLTIQWPSPLNDSTAASVDTGTYTVIGTNFLGCSDTATVIIRYSDSILVNGVKNLPTDNVIKLFPNPAKDVVIITWSAKTQSTLGLKVTDMVGRTVLVESIDGTREKFALDISSFSSGAYCVSVSGSDTNVFSGKLMVLPR